ncbi:glycosyl hydrolase family 18 protein [Paenibacillus tarimensis]
MKLQLTRIAIIVFIGIFMTSSASTDAATYSDTYPMLTVLQTTKVYSKPSLSAKVLSSIQKGQQYPVLRSSKYYHYISLPDGRFGWVRKRHSGTSDIPLQTADSVTVASVLQPTVTVYDGPSTRYKSAGIVKKGEEYPVLSVSKYYYKIQVPGMNNVWISKIKARLTGKPRLVMGWNYYGTTDTFIQQAGNAATIDVVTPRWFRLKAEAPFVQGSVDLKYVAWAHKEGKQIWTMLGNNFDPDLTNTILSDESKRNLLAKTIAEQVIGSGLDGVNVDFENIDIRNKEQFVGFIHELKELLAQSGKTVSVDVTRENPDPFWSGSYDRKGLGEAADYVIMMGYDEHWGGRGIAGSVGSEPWVREGIRLLLKDVPAHKVLLGVPFYTKEWITDSSGNVTGKDLSMPQTEKLIRDKNLTPVWDLKTKQHYVEYEENGHRHQIWIEDRSSMTWRWGLINEYRLGGAAAWAVGMETPDIWSVFSN